MGTYDHHGKILGGVSLAGKKKIHKGPPLKFIEISLIQRWEPL